MSLKLFCIKKSRLFSRKGILIITFCISREAILKLALPVHILVLERSLVDKLVKAFWNKDHPNKKYILNVLKADWIC
jgi:hypothetical protein